jgi:DNA-binding transcriptional LysR family regulator
VRRWITGRFRAPVPDVAAATPIPLASEDGLRGGLDTRCVIFLLSFSFASVRFRGEKQPVGQREPAPFFRPPFDSSGWRHAEEAGTLLRGAIGRLNIGILSSMAAGFLREVIRAYRARHPDVAVQILEGASLEQIALVRKSRLDVAFVLGKPDVPNCDVAQLWTEHMFVALPQGHILCENGEVTWEALRNEQFILCQSEKGRALHDHLIKRLAEVGHNPSIERLDVGRETLMHLVALRLGLSLTSEAMVATQFPEVTLRGAARECSGWQRGVPVFKRDFIVPRAEPFGGGAVP